MRTIRIVKMLLICFFCFNIPLFSQYNYIQIGPEDSSYMDYQSDLPADYSSHIYLGNLYHSINAGNTFRPLFNHFCPGITASFATKIFSDRFDRNIIYMAIYDRYGGEFYAPFARSINGGSDWEFVVNPFGNENGSAFLCQDAGGTLYIVVTTYNLTNISLYKSSDKGVSWQKIEINKGKKKIESSNLYYLWADPVKAGMLYAVWINGTLNGYEAAFLVSKDSGENWERREQGLEHNARGNIKYKYLPHCVTQSPTEPYRIYLINGNGYIDGHNAMAYSNDRGKNWTTLEMKKDGSQFWAVKVNPTNKNIIYAIGASAQNQTSEWGYTFYKSKDGGKSWGRTGVVNDPPNGYDNKITGAWRLFVTDTGRVIISDGIKGLLISDDEGESFKVNNKGIPALAQNLFKTNEGTFLSGGFNLHNYSSRDMQSWQRSDGPSFSIRETAKGIIVGSSGGSANAVAPVFQSSDGWPNPPGNECGEGAGIEWIESKQYLIVPPFSDYAPEKTFCMSDDLGKSWKQLGRLPVAEPFAVSFIMADPDNSNHLITGGYYPSSILCQRSELLWDACSGAIHLSEDQGYTWQVVFGQDQIGSVISLRRDECIPGVLIASASGFNEKGGVFVSEDGGHTWERRSDGLQGYETNAETLLSCAISPVRDGALYAAVNLNGGIYKSENLGRTWIKIADNPVQFSNDFIQDFVCLEQSASSNNVVPLSTLCMTDILPLDDGKESLLISTLADGLFLLEKQE